MKDSLYHVHFLLLECCHNEKRTYSTIQTRYKSLSTNICTITIKRFEKNCRSRFRCSVKVVLLLLRVPELLLLVLVWKDSKCNPAETSWIHSIVCSICCIHCRFVRTHVDCLYRSQSYDQCTTQIAPRSPMRSAWPPSALPRYKTFCWPLLFSAR